MPGAARSLDPSLIRKVPSICAAHSVGLCTGARLTACLQPSIRDYLINSNVQLGATYDVGKKATSRYEEGYQAAAKYINASREEIGTSHLTTTAANTSHLPDETPPLLT